MADKEFVLDEHYTDGETRFAQLHPSFARKARSGISTDTVQCAGY
jgi:hypothetical protein